jgi:hypothetical protein
MAQPLQTFQTLVGLAKETTWGTAVAATTADQFPPMMNPKMEELIESIYDDGYRSRASQHQGYQQGFRQSKFTFESQWFPDVCGNWLMGIMGTDGWASGTTHPFTVLNTALPPSYTAQDYYGITGTNSSSLAGLFFDTVTMSGTDKGPLKATVSLMGGKGRVLVAKPTAVYTVAQPFLTWQGALTLNSVANAKIISYDLTLKRNVLPILAMGSQDPSAGGSFQFTASGKMVFETNDDTEYLLYRNTAQAAFPISLVFTSGANTLTIVMTAAQFETPTTFDRSSPFVKTSVSFQGLDNTTDGGACKITLVGGKSGAAY